MTRTHPVFSPPPPNHGQDYFCHPNQHVMIPPRMGHASTKSQGGPMLRLNPSETPLHVRVHAQSACNGWDNVETTSITDGSKGIRIKQRDVCLHPIPRSFENTPQVFPLRQIATRALSSSNSNGEAEDARHVEARAHEWTTFGPFENK